jgi:hypothetical protein
MRRLDQPCGRRGVGHCCYRVSQSRTHRLDRLAEVGHPLVSRNHPDMEMMPRVPVRRSARCRPACPAMMARTGRRSTSTSSCRTASRLPGSAAFALGFSASPAIDGAVCCTAARAFTAGSATASAFQRALDAADRIAKRLGATFGCVFDGSGLPPKPKRYALEQPTSVLRSATRRSSAKAWPAPTRSSYADPANPDSAFDYSPCRLACRTQSTRALEWKRSQAATAMARTNAIAANNN